MRAILDFNHPRARKARLGRALLRKQNQLIIKLFIAVGIVATLAAFAVGFGLSGIIASLTLAVILLQTWAHGELDELPAHLPGIAPETLELHNVLDRRLLGRLDKADTPKQIWHGVRGTWRQRFFAVRYGLDSQIFDIAMTDDVAQGALVWERAYELAKRENQQSITGATTTVALLTTIPNFQDYLAQLHLEPDDMIVGVDWQRHIELVVERVKEKNAFGGLARDWSAGYTPILNQIGHNITKEVQFTGLLNRDIAAHRRTIDQMLHLLSTGARPNVAIVGDAGVGKTTLVYAMAQRLLQDPSVPANLRYNQVVVLNAPSILAQVNNASSIEQIMLRVLGEASAAKNVILFLDQAQLFFQSSTGSVDLSSLLMPLIERGNVRIIMAMNTNDWQALSSRNSALAGLINYVVVNQPDEENTRRIMEDQVLMIEYKHKVTFMYQALLESYRLADRYMHDMVFPGKAIRVMEMAVSHANGSLVTETSVQQAMEATLGVKIQGASAEEKEVLLNLEDQIHERMINQTRAVKVISDALRRARSGVNNPNKPVGTFMFLGPTGVGKTELAKALSAAYFGGDDQIIRVDMNEYVRSEDVQRLLAPAAESGHSLIAQIRKQPFAVVLFDEIEKAHPDVVNVLLQLLDEGKMNDTNSKSASFKDAIIIATSNAGADDIRQRIEAGQELEAFEKEFTDTLINSGQFKPEFLNRFDEIVLFRPLNKPELMEVVDLLIKGVNTNLARQKVTVVLTQDAKYWLVENGYDARLGARPLRRMVQRSVENIIAKLLLQDGFRAGSTVTLNAEDLIQSQE